ARRLFAGVVHAHAVVRVARRSVSRHLGVDVRAARTGGALALHDEHPGALAEDEAVAVAGEGARAAFGLLVPGVRDDAHDAEAGHHGLGDRRVGAAGDDVVADAELEIAIGVAEGVRRGRTAGRDQVREAVKVVGHRDLGCDRADRAGRDRIDRGLLRRALVPELVHALAELDGPAAGTEHHAHLAARLY